MSKKSTNQTNGLEGLIDAKIAIALSAIPAFDSWKQYPLTPAIRNRIATLTGEERKTLTAELLRSIMRES